MRIVALTEAVDATRYRAFFRQGLLANPEAFRISPADEQAAPFVIESTPDAFTLAAEDPASGELLGVVSFQRLDPDRERLRHRGLLLRMYVAATAQGRGIGQALITALLERVRNELPEIRQVNLTVVASNQAAKALYVKLGFVVFALEVDAIRHGATSFQDEVSMALRLYA